MSTNHYVSNKEFLAAIIEYRTKYYAALNSGEELPQMSNEIGSAILRIATKLSTKFNFVNYSYRDEMVADGVLKCIRKIHLFDPEISQNPFAYATQTIYNSFIERIKVEKHQQSVRARLIREKMSNEFIEHAGAIEDQDVSNAFVEFLKDNDVIVDHYEEQQKINKIHPSLIHRNKTPYPVAQQEVLKEPKEVVIDIFAL